MIKSGVVIAFGVDILKEKKLYAFLEDENGYYYSTDKKVILKLAKLFGKTLIWKWNGKQWDHNVKA